MRREAMVLATGAMLLLGCPKSTARGKNFTVPVPRGYATNDKLPTAPGGIALWQRQRTADDYFLGSIVVTPVPGAGAAVDPADAALCNQIGTQLAAQQNAVLESAAIIDGPFGKTCQWDVKGEPSKSAGGKVQAARGIVVKGPNDAWVLTCNHDPRDHAVLQACKQVLDGWKFD